MDIKNLNTFICTAELGSFTRAAEKLGYSQSTVSFQIKQLEQELGFPLFERINHTIALTQKGIVILQYAQQMNQLLQKMKNHTNKKTDVTGHVRLAMADSLSTFLSEQLFIRLREKYPKITIEIMTAGTEEMFRLLNQNEVDFVYTLDKHIYNTDYVIVKEAKEGIHFVTGTDTPLPDRTVFSIHELIQYPFLLTEKGMSYRRMLDEQLASLSLEVRPVVELGNTSLICGMLKKSPMLSFLPDYATREDVKAGKLKYLPVKEIEVDIWSQLLYHRDKWVSPQMQAIMDVL